jgi:hypothetical protein
MEVLSSSMEKWLRVGSRLHAAEGTSVKSASKHSGQPGRSAIMMTTTAPAQTDPDRVGTEEETV